MSDAKLNVLKPLDLPEVSEFAAMDRATLLGRFAQGIDEIDHRVAELSAEAVDTAFEPEAGVGRLSIRVLIGHLAESDQVLLHRMRRAVAEPGSVVHLWDHEAFLAAGMYGPIPGGPQRPAPPLGAALAAMHAVRQWGASWLDTLSDEEWALSVMHPENGELRVRELLAYCTWHAAYHGVFIHAKVQRLLGSA